MLIILYSFVKEMLFVFDVESLIFYFFCFLLGFIYLEEVCKFILLLKICIILKIWYV